MWKLRTLVLSLALLNVGCAPKSAEKGPVKRYQLTGTVLSVNAKDQTASIDAAAVPNYMEAMTMSYPVADKRDFEKLTPGDHIRATLNVYESGDYDLSSIRKTGAGQ